MDYSKYTILVIDDEVGYRKFYSKIIQKAFKAKVVEASNPREAFDYIKEHDLPDIIILDMQMPVLDGYSTLKMLRSNQATKDIPVIASTALNNSQLISSLIKLKISDYIIKPTNSKITIEKIRKVLDTLEN